MKFSALLFLLLVLPSCGYHWEVVKNKEGKNHLWRDYTNYRREQRYRKRMVFNSGGGVRVQGRYEGQITTDTTHGCVFIQFDSVRVYLMGEGTAAYQPIFESGLVSGQMVFCAVDSSCRPPENGFVWKSTSDNRIEEVVPDLWGWKGYTAKICSFEELHAAPGHRGWRRYCLKVSPGTHGGHGLYVLFLEIRNEHAKRRASLETFLKGGRVTFLKYGWGEI